MNLLGHMRPRFAVNNTPNCRLTDTILVGQGKQRNISGCVAPSDFAHVLFAQFGTAILFAAKDAFWMFVQPMLIAARRVSSFLLGLVKHVVFLASGKKMARILATGGVASVTDAKTQRNGTMRDGPSDTVSIKLFAGTISARAKTKLAVAEGQMCGHPRPTIIRPTDTHMRPEPKQVLRSQWRDDMVLDSHDVLLHRMSWSERSVGQSRRPFAFVAII